jgi:hypothetical protein
MKFSITQALDYVNFHSPFNIDAIDSICYFDKTTYKFKVGFNDDTFYIFDLDDGTYYKW